MATLTLPKDSEFNDGQTARGTDVRANDQAIRDFINTGQIDSGNLNLSTNYTWLGIHTFLGGSFRIDGPGAGVLTVTYANTANSRTVTVPDPGANADFLMTAGAQSKSGAFTMLAPIPGMIDKGASGTGTVTCDCSTGSKFRIQATGNFTLAFSNFTDGQRVEVWIVQDGTGSRTVTWPTVTRWLNGTGATNSTTDAPTLTTTASKFDVISFEKHDAIGTDGLLFGFIRGFKGAIT